MNPERYMFDGKLEMDPNCRIGYVSQFPQMEKVQNTTVYEYIAEEFIKLQDKITSICTEMETSTDIDTLLEKYQQALDSFNAIGGDDFESIINKKLNLANLTKHKDLMISELSGGESKLIQVIKEMLSNPDLIIMDEPDVFLDFENLNSLKDLINSHKGTLLIITHNRYLLNHCFNKILHLENMELQEFDGRFIDYNFSLLQTKIELQELAMADNEEIERNANLIDKLRDIATHNSEAARGKSLKARVKIQERLEARRIKEPFVDIKQPNISFHTNNKIEEITSLKVSDYSVSFDEMLLQNVNFQIESYISDYGFEVEILDQKIGSLSGGEKNVLQLAKVSANKANLLLLDEPTSHLDTYSQIALEKAIENYKGAILMISHDYYLISNCMDYVLIVEDKTLRKMSMKKFRRKIYANHFDRDYLEVEQKKKSIETKIESALKNTDFELAKALSEELEELIKLL